MNNKSLVKLSNMIGLVSIILLIFWVFIFVIITVFGLRVFGEDVESSFYLSIVGILSLMLGSLMINIMFNLTRIAEKHNQDDVNISKKKNKKLIILLIISFPIILGMLFGFDYMTSKKKEKMLISSAKSIVENNSEKVDNLLNYSFSKEWIIETYRILDLYSKTDTNFPYISVIVEDKIDNSQVFLGFKQYDQKIHYNTRLNKKDFIEKTTKEERDYFNKVFYSSFDKLKFYENNGYYKLFYPYIKGEKIIIFCFWEFDPKIGK